MTQKERIAMQRVLAREAIGKLQAIEELFGVENEYSATDKEDFDMFSDKLFEFQSWLFSESPIA